MGQTINDCCPCKYLIVVAVLWGEGGTQQNFLRGGLPFYTSGIPFLTKEVPFCIPFIDNNIGSSSTYLFTTLNPF